MLKDLDQSRAECVQLRQFLQRQSRYDTSVDFETTILASGCWPFNYDSHCIRAPIPADLCACVDAAAAWYQSLHSTRKLLWISPAVCSSFSMVDGWADGWMNEYRWMNADG